jgi:hypothetical protein
MAHYNCQVTGKPWQMPYQAWQSAYGGKRLSAVLLGSSAAQGGRGADRRVPLPSDYEQKLQAEKTISQKAVTVWFFFLRPALTIPFVLACLTLGNWNNRFALAVCAVVLAAVFLTGTASHPHYLAPITCLVYLVTVQGLRVLSVGRLTSAGRGRAFVRIVPVAAAVVLIIAVAGWIRAPRVPAFAIQRQEIAERLRGDSKRHLVVVRYAPDHSIYHEWVYNRADIDAATIVWARELDPESNANLLKYYADREVWLLEADAQPPRLIPHRHDTRGRADSES